MKNVDCVILAVAHDEFKNLTWKDIDEMYNQETLIENRVLIDVKGIRNKKEADKIGYKYWRL